MTTLCATTGAIARNNESAILQALARHGQKPFADAMRVSESRVSRMKSAESGKEFSEIEFWAQALAALGLKVVEAQQMCCDPEVLNASLTLIKKGVMRVDCIEDFFGVNVP